MEAALVVVLVGSVAFNLLMIMAYRSVVGREKNRIVGIYNAMDEMKKKETRNGR